MSLTNYEIGQKIKEYRKGKMTQRELAEKIGKTESSIRKYEKGLVTIPLDVIQKIADALGIVPFQLMGVPEYPEITKIVKQYYGFIEYLISLGYTVEDVETIEKIPIDEYIEAGGNSSTLSDDDKQAGFIEGESHSIKLIMNGKSIVLEEYEFEELQKSVNDIIEFNFWKKHSENHK